MDNQVRSWSSTLRFMRAIQQDDYSEVKSLLTAGVDVDTRIQSGINEKSALCFCIEERKYEMALFLIRHGASVNLTTRNGESPLHLAVASNECSVVQFLLLSRANVNARNFMMQTPLHIACSLGSYDIYFALIAAGAGINVTDIDHRTPLMLACMKGDSEIVVSLLEKGADLKYVDCLGNTALSYAVTYRPCCMVVNALLASGAEVKSKNKNGLTPLMCFFQSLGHFWCNSKELPAILKQLLKAGSEVSICNSGGQTGLHSAVIFGDVNIVRTLLNYKWDSKVDDLKKTPLFYACRYSHYDVVHLLVAAGIDWKQEKWINKEITSPCDQELVAYCTEAKTKVSSLCELTRIVIRKHLPPDIGTAADLLPCPPLLKAYITLEHF